jgi:hypothetical protein
MRSIIPILLVIVLIVAAVGWLAFASFRNGTYWAVAVIVAVPAALLVFLALESVFALPAFSIVLALIAIAVPVTFRWVNVELFRQTWIATGIALAAYLLAHHLILLPYVNREVASEVKTLNPAGTAAALVVYHPGRSNLQQRANTAFAEGLAANGWRVDLTTASHQAPTDLSGYDLLVLGTPTYDWAPSDRIKRYLADLGNLNGRPTVLIVSAMRMTGQSLPTMEKLVRQANGGVTKSLSLWTSGNERMYGIGEPQEIMRREAGAIAVP